MRARIFGFAVVTALLTGGFTFAAPQQAAGAAASPVAAQRAMIDKYCVTCHNTRLKTGGLILEKTDLTKVAENAEVWEKVAAKLRGSMMPPPGMPRPDSKDLEGLAVWLENEIDRAYTAKANPGRVGLHRLNRAEYGNAVRDLVGLEIDTTDLLPADDSNYGFDNIADALTVSPVLLERYLSGAWKVSGLAVGDIKTTPTTTTYRVRPDASQDKHVEGLPVGTRGGLVVQHNFPLDGEYRFKVRFWGNTVNTPRGLELPHKVEVLLDGTRVRLTTIGGQSDADLANTNPTAGAEAVANRVEVRIPVTAGPHTIGVTFLLNSSGPTVDILQPYEREKIDPVNTAGIPELDWVSVSGPFNPTGLGNTPSRRKILTCRPAAGADAVPCARKILGALARKAYRRPVNEKDMETLLTYFQRGQNEGKSFDAGVQNALAFILVDPQFLFRSENDPANVAPGAAYRISDLELASRMSFFLWSSIPDEPLLTLASQGKLKDPAVLDQQVRRMLADSRSESLVSNFLGQWLYLRNLKGSVPDSQVFPDFDDNLRQAFQQETEMFFSSIMREDRSVVDLVTANYTFVNERLARHYGMHGIYGDQFRRVPVASDARRGLLGQGSILTISSYANRTSPVLRGKWILTNILGTPPPPPPPNVPPLKEVAPGTMRQRMEQHRDNVACAGCHRVMDPLGFSMENFDAVGAWRTIDQGDKIDASGNMADGTKIDGPSTLRAAIAARPEMFVRTITSMLLTYGLGRGLEYYDTPVVRQIARDAGKKDYHFSEIILGIIKSAPFQMKVKKSPEAETPSVAADASDRSSRKTAVAVAARVSQ